MTKLAFIFRHAPYGTANTREGLDALLAATDVIPRQQVLQILQQCEKILTF